MSTIRTVAEAIGTCAETVTGLTVYTSDPGLAGVDGNPVLIIGAPDISREEFDSDDQLGSFTYVYDYPVLILVDLDEPSSSQTLAESTFESFSDAVDDDDQLGGTVVGARVMSGEAGSLLETARPFRTYDCIVRVKVYR